MSDPIAIVLPRREKFGRRQFGAVALTVEAYLRHSMDRPCTRVLGLEVGEPRDAACFRAVAPQYAWWRRKTIAYAKGCTALLEVEPARHIDVHQRIETLLYLSRRFPEAAVSLWLHNDPQQMWAARSAGQRRVILDAAARVICVSGWVRERFLAGLEGHEARERTIVFPNPIEIDSAPLREKEKLILYVGRLRADKGPHLLAEALSRVMSRLPGWRALFVGEGERGGNDYVCRLRAALAPLGERVGFQGFLPHEDIQVLYARAAIAVVPSLWEEPFGRTALEALAGGAALIATLRGGLPEVVGHAAVPLVPETAERLAAILLELAASESLRAGLSELGRKQAGRFEAGSWSARLDALRREIEAKQEH
jgi:glycosyltransferase involved in cell wall biosynthesis